MTQMTGFRERLLRLVLVAGFASILTVLMVYLALQADWNARQSSCSGNMATIVAVWRAYVDQHGGPPPLVTHDESGQPMHSWRLLLARFEKPDDFAGYNMSEPWNSQNNRKYLMRMPPYFRCPNDVSAHNSSNQTSYVGVASGQSFAGSLDGQGDIDESSQFPLVVVEMAESGIRWTEPRDLDINTMSYAINDFTRPSIRSRDPIGPEVMARVDLRLWREI